jgi:alpha-D-xyloside xylohydrolase
MANPFPQNIAWQLQPSGPFVSLAAGPLEARVYRNTGHIEIAGPDLAGNAKALTVHFAAAVHTAQASLVLGAVDSSQQNGAVLEVKQKAGANTVTAHLSFPSDGVIRYEVVDWGGLTPVATAVALPSIAQEHCYGLGEHFDSFDQSGKKVHMLAFDEPGVKGGRAYKVSPWFVSTRGYGLHLDSSAECEFDLRASAADRITATSPTGALRCNLVFGPQLTAVLTRFTAYAGRPPVPPPWTFGVWISSDVWRSGGEVRYAVTQFRQRGIPASAFVFDSPWEVAYNDFRFNLAQFAKDDTIDGQHFAGFASLHEMMTFFQTNGLKVIVWMAPFVNVQSDADQPPIPGQNLGKAANYDEGAQKNFFVRSSPGGAPLVVKWWKGRGSPIDFTSAGARGWVAGQLNTLVTDCNVQTASGASETAIGGFKTDDGESGTDGNTYIPTTASYADGRSGIEMRNAYCLEYHKAIGSVLGNCGVLFARSGFIGSQGVPGSWAGDNEPNFGDNGLPSVIIAGQSAAMSGYAIWGHDVGGYQDTNPSLSPPNLFMRWTQFGCFSPIMQMHRQVAKAQQYPWRYGDAALANFIFFASLHLRLFPYINTYAKLAAETGLPIIRPLVLLNPTDANTFGLRQTYLFGNEFLVAPIITPNANQRTLYLPAGAWFDFWNNQRRNGGSNITWTNANQQQFPLFAREGAIIPMLPEGVVTLCTADYVNNPAIHTPGAALVVLVYPGGSSQFTVYDGTLIRCDAGAATKITFTSADRPVRFEIVATAAPAQVTRNGAPLTKFNAAADFDNAAAGWRFATGKIFVKFGHVGGTSTVEF